MMRNDLNFSIETKGESVGGTSVPSCLHCGDGVTRSGGITALEKILQIPKCH